MNPEDLRILAAPVEPPAFDARAFNRRLQDRFGSCLGTSWFRVVPGWSETTLFNGRTVMKYRKRGLTREVRYELTSGGETVEVDSVEPADWSEDVRARFGAFALLSPVVYYRESGDPYWYVEGFVAPEQAVLTHDALDGDAPTAGEYRCLFRIEGDREESREPGERDIERIAAIARKQETSPLYRDMRWDEGYDPGAHAKTRDREAALTAEAEQRDTERTYEQVPKIAAEVQKRLSRIISLPG